MRLQFVRSTTIAAEVIEWFDHGTYSHCMAVLPDGSYIDARSNVIGDIPAGVQRRPADYEPWATRLVVDLPSTPAVDAIWIAWLRSQIGTPYDEIAIGAFLFGTTAHRVGAWMCSELQTAALMACGWFKTSLIAPANKIAPDDLALVLSALVEIKS
jgi:hypothetical protein